MKYTHTPGPWTAFQAYPQRHTIGTPNGKICDLWGADPAFYTDEDEANARLIAAAPELLEALVDLIAGHNLSQDEPEEYPDEEAGLQAREVWGRAQQAIDAAATQEKE
jgi:hypothetical protein